jgi:predicted O-methyltransferase YrrM
MNRRIQILLWCLQRPAFYPFLLQKIPRLFSPGTAARNRRQAEATAWCSERAVDNGEALARIGGQSQESPLAERYAAMFEEAERVVAACPIRMGGAGNLELLYGLAEFCSGERVIETGVAYGWSTLAILLSLQHRKDGRLVSSELPYPLRCNDTYVGCVVPDSLRSQWQMIHAPDCIALPRALRMLPEIDVCHYDSDKSYEDRCWAYPRLWRALRPGGVFLSDDVGDNFAFRDFAWDLKVEPIVVRKRAAFVGVLVKPR